MVNRRRRRKPARRGSVPGGSWHVSDVSEPVAQPVEHLTFNQGVSGSNPDGLTIFFGAATLGPPPAVPVELDGERALLIVYLMTRLARHTVRPSLPYFPDDLRRSIRVLTYGAALKMRALPVATYIFSDVERLGPQAQKLAARIWTALERSGRPVRLINHPIRAMRRPELLRNLFERGINDFNAYPALQPPIQMRFPVFLRGASDHDGPRSDLIYDRTTLDAEIAKLEAAGLSRQDCLIVEFCDTRDGNGIFRKHDAFLADGKILPTDVYFSSNWVVKWESNRVFNGHVPTTASLAREEVEYISSDRYCEQLRQAVAPTHIGYGRIDYALLGDRVQIWEINTNPDLWLAPMDVPERLATPYARDVFPQVKAAIFSAFRSLDTVADEDAPIPVDLSVPIA